MKPKVKHLHFVAVKARNGKPLLWAAHALARAATDSNEATYAA